MKEIKLPKQLLGLPSPWRMTHSSKRHKQIKRLSDGLDEVNIALNVLERCLHVLSQLTLSSQDAIPEDLLQYWDFSADWLARKIPVFDDFERAKVEEFLTEYGIESPSAKMIGQVACYWFWSVTRDIAKAVLRWVHEPLRGAQDSLQVARLLEMMERYWSRIPPRLTQYLLGRCATIGWDKALPYLSRIELDPKAQPDVRKTARDYRRLVLNNPDKWMRTSEGSPKFSVNGTSQTAQRALSLSLEPMPSGVA